MPYINVFFILIIHLIRLLFSKKLQFGLSCIYLIILRKYKKFTNSRPEVVCKKGVPRNFAKFTGRHLYQKLFFNKVEGLACKFIKKSLWHRYFPVNFAKFLRMPFFERPPPVTASKLSRLNCNIKKTLKGFNDE